MDKKAQSKGTLLQQVVNNTVTPLHKHWLLHRDETRAFKPLGIEWKMINGENENQLIVSFVAMERIYWSDLIFVFHVYYQYIEFRKVSPHLSPSRKRATSNKLHCQSLVVFLSG